MATKTNGVLTDTKPAANSPAKVVSAAWTAEIIEDKLKFSLTMTTTADSADASCYLLINVGALTANTANSGQTLKGKGQETTFSVTIKLPVAGEYPTLSGFVATMGSNLIAAKFTAAIAISYPGFTRPADAVPTNFPPIPALSGPKQFFDQASPIFDPATNSVAKRVRVAWPKGFAWPEGGFFLTPKAQNFYYYERLYVGVQGGHGAAVAYLPAGLGSKDLGAGTLCYLPSDAVTTTEATYDYIDVVIRFILPDKPGEYHLDIPLYNFNIATLYDWGWNALIFAFGQWYDKCPPEQRPNLLESFKPIGQSKTSYGVNTGTGLAFKEGVGDWSSCPYYKAIKALGFQHVRVNASLSELLKAADPELCETAARQRGAKRPARRPAGRADVSRLAQRDGAGRQRERRPT